MKKINALQTFFCTLRDLRFLTPFSNLNTLQTFAKAFAGVTFFYYLFKAFDWAKLYGPSTLIPQNFTTEIYPEVVRPWLYVFPQSQWVAFLLYGLMMLIVGVSVFRPLPVVIKLVAWTIHIMFFYRNVPSVYGGDLILNALYIYYIFSEVKNKNIYKLLLLSAQVQVIVVYFVSALTKLAGRTWIEGSAVGLVLQNHQMVFWPFDLLALAPLVSAILSWWVLFFELGSPFGFFVKQTKWIWILSGMAIHLFIALTMGLWFFSAKMVITYILFRPEDRS